MINFFKDEKFNKILEFFIIFFVSFFIFYFLLNMIPLQNIYVDIISFQNANNFESIVKINNGQSMIIDGFQINVNDVCAGAYELSVFISLILATSLIKIKRRIFGIILFIPIFFLFNLFRMNLVIFTIFNFNIFIAEFLHIFVFKLGFFLLFVCYYYIFLIFNR